MRWTLEEGLRMVRTLQPETRQFNYHLCLGGSVLNRGESDKDIDLFFLPLAGNKEAKTNDLVLWLSRLWGMPEQLGLDYEQPRENEEDERELRVPITWGSPSAQSLTLAGASVTQPSIVINESNDAPYKFKLKFHRGGGDRIDVFIF